MDLVPFERVAGFLQEKYGVLPKDIEVLEGGHWSQAFGFDSRGQRTILRIGQHREDYDADEAAFGYASDDLPIPLVFEIGEAFGRYYALSTRADGVFLESLDAAGWRATLPALWRALDHLRSCPPHPGARPDGREGLLAQLEDQPGGRVSGWSARMAPQSDIANLFSYGLATLRMLLARCPPICHVVHADLLNRNVLVDPDTHELSAVFDWGCSIGVDFLYELAGITFWAQWYPSIDAVCIRDNAAHHYREIGLDVTDFDLRMEAYELHIGLVHMAYHFFAKRPENELRWIADRTRQVLDRV